MQLDKVELPLGDVHSNLTLLSLQRMLILCKQAKGEFAL